MGVRHVLLLVDPAQLERCVRVLGALEELDAKSMRRALDELGGPAASPEDRDDNWLRDLAERDDEETHAFVRNELLEKVVGARDWELDKGLGEPGVGGAIELVPALAPLRMFTEFGFDVELPADAFAPEDSGLYGFYSADRLDACLPAVRRFDTRDAARASLEGVAWTWGARLTAKPARARNAVTTWTSDYGWDVWSAVREAILEATGRRWHLGLSMTI